MNFIQEKYEKKMERDPTETKKKAEEDRKKNSQFEQKTKRGGETF